MFPSLHRFASVFRVVEELEKLMHSENRRLFLTILMWWIGGYFSVLSFMRFGNRTTTPPSSFPEGINMPNKKHSHKELYRCLGEVIALRRKRMGLSQEELSEASGVDRSFLSSVERGKRNPSFGTVASIASGLKMRYTRLISSCEQCIASKQAS